MVSKIGFIGLGLIGGSLAKAFRKYNLVKEIIAYDINEASLISAKNENILTDYSTTIDHSFADCEIIFLCCPVKENVKAIKQLIPFINEHCILTDVGSTKENITDAIKEIEGSFSFIGGHPMTGSEKSGYSASSPILYENTYYILTPIDGSIPEHIECLKELLLKINAIPIVLFPDQHDYITATISHVPHIIASTLVNLVQENDSSEQYMHTLAAGGFKDLTRIASSSPKMWQQICMSNKDNIITVLDQFKDEITAIQDSIRDNKADDIYSLFEDSKTYRDSFENKGFGNVIKSYILTVDVEDKPGIITKIASVLSSNNINIKNIGIINNREHQKGVLEIVFYDQLSYDKSYTILENLNYTVYKF